MADHDDDHALLQGLDAFFSDTPGATPLDHLHYYWRKVPQDERIRFLTEMLTPNERRALQFGFDEDEEPAP